MSYRYFQTSSSWTILKNFYSPTFKYYSSKGIKKPNKTKSICTLHILNGLQCLHHSLKLQSSNLLSFTNSRDNRVILRSLYTRRRSPSGQLQHLLGTGRWCTCPVTPYSIVYHLGPLVLVQRSDCFLWLDIWVSMGCQGHWTQEAIHKTGRGTWHHYEQNTAELENHPLLVDSPGERGESAQVHIIRMIPNRKLEQLCSLWRSQKTKWMSRSLKMDLIMSFLGVIWLSGPLKYKDLRKKKTLIGSLIDVKLESN